MTDSVDIGGTLQADPAAVGCRLLRITGRVQGVFFRASTQTAARDLGLGGYARNLDDGSVEVLACGSLAAIDRLQEWLREGPPMAQVDHVEVQPGDPEPRDEFTIG